MLEFLRGLFKCRVCEAHIQAVGLMERHISDLKDERNELRAENKLMHEKLFMAVRLRDPEIPRGIAGLNAGPSQKQQTGPVKSWPRLRADLEKQHQRKPDDEKLKHWQDVNAKAEAEIPELAAMSHNSELEKDLKDLA